jgi:hypothetical protein
VQSSRVAVTEAQAGAVGRVGTCVVVFDSSSGKLDWARIRGARKAMAVAKDFIVYSSGKYSKPLKTSDCVKKAVCLERILNRHFVDLCIFLTLAWLTLWRPKFSPRQFPWDFPGLGNRNAHEAHSLGQASTSYSTCSS